MTQTAQTETKTMLLNVGPSHPATHGVIEINAELDGEIVARLAKRAPSGRLRSRSPVFGTLGLGAVGILTTPKVA